MSPLEKRLITLVGDLDAASQQSLLDYAEFLASRSGAPVAPDVQAEPEQPSLESRPDEETVVGAIQRLRRGYPMLDRRSLLGDTSNAMSKHVIGGVAAVEVIDQLEVVFSRKYEEYLKGFES